MPKSMAWSGGSKPRPPSEAMPTSVGISAGGSGMGSALEGGGTPATASRPRGASLLELESDEPKAGMGIDVATMEQKGADENSTTVGRMRMRRR